MRLLLLTWLVDAHPARLTASQRVRVTWVGRQDGLRRPPFTPVD